MNAQESLLPIVPDLEAYRKVRGDPVLWLDAVAVICARHGIDSENLYAEPTGTNIVFRAGRGPWIKLFPPLWPEDFVRERTALAAVTGAAGLAVPQLLEEGTLEDWPYVVLSHVEGEAIGTVWTDVLRAEEQVDLAHQTGELLAQLHRVDTAACDPIREDWAGWAAEQRAVCAERQAGYGLDEPWVHELRANIANLPPMVTPGTPAVFLHADVTDEHIYVQRVDGRWRITGLIDFGDAMVGDPLYEFAAPLVFLAQRRPHVQRAIVAGYGWDPHDLAPDVAHRMTAWCFLHRWGRIGSYGRFTPGRAPRNLAELAEAIWSPP